ncbi:o-succinylbenzoate synthase [Hoyosella sp. YIM 151337]|nr:o-succinylbenzoate synthase [Hoyosella sp. YIM 151337]MCW4352834.1 o-succinylbenzoate synthase [Hoyosella sp. YIM 151337]
MPDVLAATWVVTVPLRVRFRGIMAREAMLIRGPAGWSEFAPFPEYDDREAATWLMAAIDAAWNGLPPARRDVVPVNATVPAVPAARVGEVLARYEDTHTAKVKVGEAGQTLSDDVARVNAVRERIPNVRVDANGAWTVTEAEAAITALTRDGQLEYAEQPCRTVAELAELRRRLDGRVRIAADESIRRATDPFLVVEAGAADVAVVKVAPLGGPRRVLHIAHELEAAGIPVVVSSALDTAVGIACGVSVAAALPRLDFACGLATSRLLADDVGSPSEWSAGGLRVHAPVVDTEAAHRLSAPDARRQWWRARLARCYQVLASVTPEPLGERPGG